MPTGNENLRNALADSVSIVKKGQDKLLDKLDELAKLKEKIGTDGIKQLKEMKEFNTKGNKDLLKAIGGIESAEIVAISNPEAITGDLKKGLQGIIEALQTELKNFDKNIVVKNDFSNFASLFKSSQDKTSVINALKAIEDKIETPEMTDYTMILSDIATAVESKEAVNILKDILAKEYNIDFPSVMPIDLDPNLIEKNRVKVVLRDDQVNTIVQQGGANNAPIIAKQDENIAKLTDIETNQTDGSQITQIYDGSVGPAELDNSTNSIQTIEYEHHEIHSGSHYFICDSVELGNAGVIDLTIQTPDTTEETHILFSVEGTQRIQLQIFEGSDLDADGTLSVPPNNDRNSDKTSNLILRTNPTVNTVGTAIFNSVVGSNKTAGVVSRAKEIILKRATKYIFRITNTQATATVVSWCGEWYEHTPKN